MDILNLKKEDIPVVPAPAIAHYINVGVDPKRGVIHLSDEIDESDAGWFAQALDYIAHQPQTPDRIRFYLNTPGGDVGAMFAIHDLIRSSPIPVEAVGYGCVASAGVLIFACCHRRLVTESCVLMSHESRAGVDSEGLGFKAAKDRRRFDDWQYSFWCELMSRYTPDDKDARWWKRTTERQGEYWLLGGDEIVAAGLADAVVRGALR